MNKKLSPLTGSSNVLLLDEYSPSDIALLWKTSMGIDVGKLFSSLPTLEYWKCQDTGLGFYSPSDAAGAGHLYTQLEKFNWYYMEEKWEFETALNILEKGERVLEVGVGFGHFLKKARERHFQINGVELNPSAAELSRSKGFEIYEIDLESLSSKTLKLYDVICSFQVLEHIAEPGNFLRGMLGNLRNGGRLILSVPNAEVMRRIDPNNKNILNQAPHHMGHWDEQVFRALEHHFPVKVRSVYQEPLADYHIAEFVTGYLRGVFSKLGSRVNRVFFNRYSTAPIQWILKMGLKNRISGHTLMVEIEKVE